ncbi:Uma2 family endonuclease [Nocardia wallacei]|uniref:Uma2 family endonuclease n=1 Tax=Nocardia wallacei TaxID=480035 RepID=UPI00245717D1|nr:Uma2 family endonuclease [Nocardia wallacei]
MTAVESGRTVFVPSPPPAGFTAADLPDLIEKVDASFELLDGQVVVEPLSTVWHNEARDALKAALRDLAPMDIVITSGAALDLGNSVPVPDLLAIDRAAVRSDRLSFLPASVRLVVEVVSPGTVTRDRVLRPVVYAEAGIPHFWRVENQDGAMALRAFDLRSGDYTPTGVFTERVELDLPFAIDVELPAVTW